MTAHLACPCGWTQDVDLLPSARVSITQLLVAHAREHIARGEDYRAPTVTVDAAR